MPHASEHGQGENLRELQVPPVDQNDLTLVRKLVEAAQQVLPDGDGDFDGLDGDLKLVSH